MQQATNQNFCNVQKYKKMPLALKAIKIVGIRIVVRIDERE
jgi:hypothetical protein